MRSAPLSILMECLSALPDPRVERTRLHQLLDVLTLGICGVICGAEGWDDIARFGRSKEEWLREKLGLCLPNAIPCADTFRRVFARLQPQKLQEAFQRWTKQLYVVTRGEVISLDGKTLRHSFDTAFGQSPIHMVSAWASSARLVLGAVKVDEKSNEITAVPLLLAAIRAKAIHRDGKGLRHSFEVATAKRALHLVRAFASEVRLVLGTAAVEDKSNEIPAVRQLLPLLDLRGALVPADAAHCQRETAEQIRRGGGDYLLSLKGNQDPLFKDTLACFERMDRASWAPSEWLEAAVGRAFESCTQHDKGQGRLETRRVSMLRLAEHDPDWHDVQALWPGLRTLLRIERTRQLATKSTQETAYYINRQCQSARYLGRMARQHWQIENGLHYVLDVSLGENASRIHADNSALNLGTMRSIVMNLLSEKSRDKSSVPRKQKKAGWNNDYLLELFA